MCVCVFKTFFTASSANRPRASMGKRGHPTISTRAKVNAYMLADRVSRTSRKVKRKSQRAASTARRRMSSLSSAAKRRVRRSKVRVYDKVVHGYLGRPVTVTLG